MTHIYLPEGRQSDSPANRRALSTVDGLTQAMQTGHILEGTVLSCTPEHDLLVQAGPFTGMIPRLEAAIGIAQGTTREIAILSRVGRPVCFVVTGLDTAPDGSVRPILSRRLAQERVLNYYLVHLRPGDILPATCLLYTSRYSKVPLPVLGTEPTEAVAFCPVDRPPGLLT